MEVGAALLERRGEHRRRRDRHPVLGQRALLGAVRVADEAHHAAVDLRLHAHAQPPFAAVLECEVEEEERPHELGRSVRPDRDVQASREGSVLVREQEALACRHSLDRESRLHVPLLPDLEDVGEVPVELDDKRRTDWALHIARDARVVVQRAGHPPVELEKETAFGERPPWIADLGALEPPAPGPVPDPAPGEQLPLLAADRHPEGREHPRIAGEEPVQLVRAKLAVGTAGHRGSVPEEDLDRVRDT